MAGIKAGAGFAMLLRRNLFTGATIMIRRAVVDAAMPIPDSWIHDEWLACVASAMGDVDILADSLVDYRQHGGNQIGALKFSALGKARRVIEPRSARNARLLS